MDTDTNTVQPAPKQPKYYQKTLDAFKLIEAGLTPREALQAANMTTKVSDAAVCALKNKLKKHSLTDPATVKLASSQIKRILKARAREEVRKKVLSSGEVVEYTDNIYPTDTNIIAAASMVYDRYEPVQRADQAPGTVINYLDLSQVTNGTPDSLGVDLGVHDITPTNNSNEDSKL